MNSISQIFTGYKYGIDFFDADGNIVRTDTFTDEAAFDTAFDTPDWPETAVSLDSWRRKQYRKAIYGVDYGPGSVKARFGGGYVPRAAYQFGGA